MKTKGFNLAVAVSAILLVAIVVVWVRSYFIRDTYFFGSAGGNAHYMQSLLGRVHLQTTLTGSYLGGSGYASKRLPAGAMWDGGRGAYPLRPEWHFGFIWQTYAKTSFSMLAPGQLPVVSRYRLIVVPYWSIAIVFAVLPSLWIARFVYRWRMRRNPSLRLCATCGYDLRATSDRCPECGTPVAPTAV